MLKRLAIVFTFFLVTTGLFIVYKNMMVADSYAWYDGIGMSALATFFYWVLVSVLEKKNK
ncbi:hypothetical protein [Streptococcus porci]|uniref:hypothetical protein n=1 Tax=Streptococcus porci TaxID=502567 RepID=UPI00041CB993|nr:hypothetical protein [Streptococcus porci]